MASGTQGRVLIGTSGWSYPHWRKRFYPPKLPHRRELPFLAQRVPTVELNGTFYSLTRPEHCDAWRAAAPPGFVFAVKGSRYITHMLKLRKFEAPLSNFLASGLLRLGAQLGPLLWQLPPQLPFDADRARGFLSVLPRTVREAEGWARRHDARVDGRAAVRAPDGAGKALRHAIEIRHESWLSPEALALLRAHDVALVHADAAGLHPLCFDRTASFVYVRLHGSTALYRSRYTDDELAAWADRIAAWRADGTDVFVYFDNDGDANAPADAVRLGQAVRARAPVGPAEAASGARRPAIGASPGGRARGAVAC
jgi:uncharacterized protein YecE (DUF72 family)